MSLGTKIEKKKFPSLSNAFLCDESCDEFPATPSLRKRWYGWED